MVCLKRHMLCKENIADFDMRKKVAELLPHSKLIRRSTNI